MLRVLTVVNRRYADFRLVGMRLTGVVLVLECNKRK
jgi:hypothetical protein